MFTMLVVLLAGFALCDIWLLHEANSRDLSRAQRYAGFARKLLEEQDDGTPSDAALEHLRDLGPDQVDWLPSNAAPAGKSPRSRVPGTSVEAWEAVKNHDGSTRGYVRITHTQNTSQLVLRAVRWFALMAVLGFAAVFVAAWLGINRLVCAPIADMARRLGVESSAVASDPLTELETVIERTVHDLQGELGKAQRILDQHDEAVCFCTTDGVIRDVNSAFCRILGKPRDEIVGTNRLDLVPASERTDALDSLRRLSRRTPESSVTHRVMVANGGVRWIRWRDAAVFATDDSVKEVVSFGFDITEEQQLADEIASVQGAFDQMQSLASTGSLTWDLTRDKMQWTAETFRLLSLDPSLVSPCLDTLLTNVASDDRTVLQHLFERACNEGNPFEHEFRVQLPDGALRFLQSRAEVRIDPRTKLLDKLTCTLRDITALRDAEAARLRESILREAVENALGVGIVILDKEGHPISANPAYLAMIGRNEDELRAMKPPYPFWPKEDLPQIEEALRQALSGQCPSGGSELRFQRKTGEVFDVLISTVKLNSAQGEQLGYVSSVTDITHIQETRRKLAAAETLARMELTFREAIEKSFNMGIFVSDMEGNAISINDGFAAMTGLTRQEIMAQKPPFSWWPEEELSKIQQAWDSAFVSGKISPEGYEMTFCRKDGTRFDVLDLLAPFRDAQGRQTGWISALIDITKIQQTRRRLVEVNEVLSIAAEVADAGVWVIEPNTCRNEWSRQAFAIHGDPDGQNAAETYARAVPPEERERSDAYLRQVIESGESSGQNEMDIVWPDGSVHRIASNFRVIRHEKKAPAVVVGIHRDITGFIRREQELRDANRRIAAALDSSEFGTFEHLYGVGSLNWNTTNYKLHGLDPSIKDPDLLFKAWKNIVGDDVRRLEDAVNNLPGNESSCSYEYDLQLPATGEAHRIRASVFIERGKDGSPVRLVGVNHRVH